MFGRPISPIQETWFFTLVTVSVLIAIPGMSKATSEEDAISLCVEALKNDYGASDIRNLDFHRHDDRPFVYGYANTGSKRVSFRSFVFQEKVESVDYLEPDASVSTGHSWVSAPHSKASAGDTTADAPAEVQREPLHPAEPHFVTVQ